MSFFITNSRDLHPTFVEKDREFAFGGHKYDKMMLKFQRKKGNP